MAEESKGFADMFAEYDAPKRSSLQTGDEVTARIVAIGSTSVFVDVGGKSDGVIDRAELCDSDGEFSLKVGDSITARVASTSGDNIVLRIKMGTGADSAEELLQAQQSGIAVSGTVTGINKGGADVEIGGTRAFCPVSQLDVNFVEDPSTFVGQRLEFRVTRYEAGRGGKPNIVVSRKALLAEERARQSAELLSKLEIGSVVSGKVTTLKEYGAFVDIGGIEGMIHVTELGFGRVGHPSDMLKTGDVVDVQVMKIERATEEGKRDRVGLSLKALKADPWDEADIKEGSRLKGEVVRLETFGAFVALPNGVEGLVHVSELGASKRVIHPREVVSVGQTVEVVVLGIDNERHRVSLSVKAVASQKEAQDAAGYKPTGGSFGTFADLLKGKK